MSHLISMNALTVTFNALLKLVYNTSYARNTGKNYSEKTVMAF